MSVREVLRDYGRATVSIFDVRRRFDLFGAWLPAALLILVALAFLFGWHR